MGPPPSQDAWASQAGADGMSLAESETDGECSSYYRVTWEPHLSQQTEVGQLCYDPVNQSLTMVNKDIALHRRCLLLGYTNKMNLEENQRASIIGKFGEGMKIGALALLRDGRRVCVRTSQDCWRFGLKQHSIFQEEILTVFVTQRSEGTSNVGFEESTPPCNLFQLLDGDTCTQIWPIEPEEWNCFLKRFLFLERPSSSVNTNLGTLLLDDSLHGQLYIREVWIQDMSEEGLDTGVNVYDIKVDRDRNSTEKKSDIEYRSSCIWVKALKVRPDLAGKYFDLLSDDPPSCDVRHAVLYMDKDVASILTDLFFKRHGENAIPIENNTPHDKMYALQQDPNKKVVLCNKNLMKILTMSGRIPDMEEELKKIQQQKQEYITHNDLKENEHTVLIHAEKMVQMVEPEFLVDAITISTSDRMEVLYSKDKIEIPRWWLSTEEVHAKKISCNLPNCMCAPTNLCITILQTWQGGTVNTTARHTMLTSLLAAQTCEKARAQYEDSDNFLKGKEDAKYLTDYEQDIIQKRERELEKSKNDLKKQFEDAQKQNEKVMDDLKTKLEDVNQAYSNDKIRLTEKDDQLLSKFKTEKAQDKAKYENLIQLKDTEGQELEKKIADTARELEEMKDDRERLEGLEREAEEIHQKNLNFNLGQTKVFVERLSVKVQEIDSILKVSDGVMKNSELQDILTTLKVEIEESAKMDKCYMCNKKQRNCALDPCGHEDICTDCAEKMERCHHCRVKIIKRLHTFS
ncbi:RING finger protein B-like isoform X2 [Dysidea avara]